MLENRISQQLSVHDFSVFNIFIYNFMIVFFKWWGGNAERPIVRKRRVRNNVRLSSDVPDPVTIGPALGDVVPGDEVPIPYRDVYGGGTAARDGQKGTHEQDVPDRKTRFCEPFSQNEPAPTGRVVVGSGKQLQGRDCRVPERPLVPDEMIKMGTNKNHVVLSYV